MSIPAGESSTVSLPIMGLGAIDIVATVDEVTVIANGFVLFFFIIVIPT